MNPALQISPFVGDMHIDVNSLLLLGFGVPTNGATTAPLATPGTASPALIGNQLMFQGLVFDIATGGGRVSNAQVVDF